MTQGMTRSSVFEEALSVLRHRTVHEACSCCLECNPGPLHHYDEKKWSRPHWIIFSRGQIELNPARSQNLSRQCPTWVRLQLALHLLVLVIHQFYHLPPPLPPPVNNLLARLLDASLSMPAVVLYLESTTCKIRNVLFCCLLRIICVKSTIRLL